MPFGLRKKEIPVYIFRGFLDSGKTTFIRETLEEGQFQDGKKTLLIYCEEGEEELSDEILEKNKFTVETVDDEEDVSPELFKNFDKKHKPDRVIVETNGMWDADEVIAAFPQGWSIAETITTVDATTFETYLANMKMMVTNQFKDADLVLFNRVDDSKHERAMFKRMVRAVNRMGQVLFETTDGTVDSDAHEEPPYDISAPVIQVKDEDFGIFYLDALDHLDNFKGRIVEFKGQVYHPKGAKDDVFVPGRFAMTCCAEDVAFVGFPCRYDEAFFLRDKDWVQVKAKIGSSFSKEYGQDAPVLYAQEIGPASKAEEDIVYFN